MGADLLNRGRYRTNRHGDNDHIGPLDSGDRVRRCLIYKTQHDGTRAVVRV